MLLYAGLTKIAEPLEFYKDVHNFRMLPEPLERGLTMTLPWVEIVCATCLAGGILRSAAALVATGLMGIFLTAVTTAWVRGLDITCGCFGISEAGRTVGAMLLIQDVLLLGMAITLLIAYMRTPETKTSPAPRPDLRG